MILDDFIKKFALQYDDMPNFFNADTNFREVDGWSSLVALSLIAMVDEDYHVELTADDLGVCTTVKDIYNIVLKKVSIA